VTGLAYLAALIVSSACLLLVDRRFRLFYWRDVRSALIVTVIGLGALLVFDASAIALKLFYRGESAGDTGIVLAPELPLEEPIFLWFLVLCTMVIYTGAERILKARERR